VCPEKAKYSAVDLPVLWGESEPLDWARSAAADRPEL
jgi:hypothetical protein